MPSTETYRERVERLARKRNWTYETVAGKIDALEIDGASRSSVIQAKHDPRKLNRAIIEAAAVVLDVDNDDFPEWRAIVIAETVRLDHGNLDQVVANLKTIQRKPSAATLEELPAAPKRRVGDAARDAPSGAPRRLADHARRRRNQAERESREEPGSAEDTP